MEDQSQKDTDMGMFAYVMAHPEEFMFDIQLRLMGLTD
jgi:hypothetical protein